MTTEKLMQYLPDREYVASALGLRRAQPLSLLAGLGFFGTGLLIGSALALLFSPRSGPELRRDLKGRVDDAWHRIQQPRVDGEDRPRASS